MAAHHIGPAENKLDSIGRQPCINQAADQRGGAARRFFGRLGNHRATRRKRRGKFLGHEVNREIPRGERRDRTDRLLDDDRALPGRANQHAAIGAFGFLGTIVEQGGSAGNFAARFGDRLALLERQQRGDGLGAFAQKRRGFPKDRAARINIQGPPRLKTFVGRSKRFIEIGRRSQWQSANGIARRRIDDLRQISPFADPPTAIDEKLKVCIINCGHEFPRIGGMVERLSRRIYARTIAPTRQRRADTGTQTMTGRESPETVERMDDGRI